ncbi:MAG: primosomal protein N' [Phycisphaerae bacterium]
MQLFEDGQSAAKTAQRVVGVAVNAHVWGEFDYVWPGHFGQPQRGQRVRVPFGRGDRRTLGFVVDPSRKSERTGEKPRKLKSVAEVVDEESRLTEKLWDLAHWISHYYLAPPGVTLAAMIPSAVGRRGERTEQVAILNSTRPDWPSTLGSRQRRVLDELFEARRQGVEELPLREVLRKSGATRDSVNRLVGRGLLRLASREVHLPEVSGEQHEPQFELNDDQKSVLSEVEPVLGEGFCAMLLHGVTGSGKTEIYVRAIRNVIAKGRQAIVLVPEIALATQTLHRLLERLPRVAVLHSGLTDAERAFHYEQIRRGNADVVVGPRSAVFAPTPKLGFIVVDEEHEPSYKQDTAPRYHGRDTAVKRASLEDVPILLGSATPSLESLHNARRGRYKLLRLPHRVRGLPMPHLEVVHLRKELQPGRIELIGRTLTQKMAAALDRDEQTILLMNRRGYASHVFCPSCGWIMTCRHCTRTMVFHQATQMAVCHYCQQSASLPESCPGCRGKLLLFGYGIQRIESELARKFPEAISARMDSDTMTSPKQFRKVFDGFAAGEIDILLGTQMVAKGLDFPRVSLVGVVSADTSLAIPDFRAAERTFQLIVQVAGRAGRSDRPGEVVVQTLNEDEPAISFAVGHDYQGFADNELPLRKEVNLPPFARLVRFLARHKDVSKADAGARELARRLRGVLTTNVSMLGPQPAGVKKIRDRFRFELLLICDRPGYVQDLLAGRMAELTKGIAGEIIAEPDPVNLM